MTKILGPVADTPAERERDALEGLETLVDLYRRGISEPIPLFGATSYRYAERGSIDYKVRNEWVGSYYYPGEDTDPHHVLVFDGVMALDELATEPPFPDETGAGWPAADSRFEVLALRLWEPILAASGGGE
jgi:exodeoxyribonuclease V gamma subunit